MSKIVLFDKTEFYLDERLTEQVKRSLLRSNKGFLQIGDMVINKSNIKAILTDDRTAADRMSVGSTDRKLLQTDSRSQQERYIAARKAATRVRGQLEDKGIVKPRKAQA